MSAMAKNQEQNNFGTGRPGSAGVEYQEDCNRVIGRFGAAALGQLPLGPGAGVLEAAGCGARTTLLELARGHPRRRGHLAAARRAGS
jgi:hypothetical protein